MEQKHSINFSGDLLGGFTSIFMNLVYVIIAVFVIVMIINFLRDKFINKEPNSKRDDIIDLLTVLNKLFLVSGFGFVIGNILQILLTKISSSDFQFMLFKGEWHYFTFGIILIFIGLGFKTGKKIVLRDRMKE